MVEAGLTPLLEEVEVAALEAVVEAVVEVGIVLVRDAGRGTVRRTTSDCTRQRSPDPRVEGEDRPSPLSLLEISRVT